MSTVNKSILLYNKDKHFKMLKSWYDDWKIPVNLDYFPTTGLIIEDICAVFWYETNSPICLIEGFISNPLTKPEERDEYLDKIVDTLFHVTREKGFKIMLGTTKYKHVLDRTVKHGFKSNDEYTLFGKNLIGDK